MPFLLKENHINLLEIAFSDLLMFFNADSSSLIFGSNVRTECKQFISILYLSVYSLLQVMYFISTSNSVALNLVKSKIVPICCCGAKNIFFSLVTLKASTPVCSVFDQSKSGVILRDKSFDPTPKS